MFSSISGKPPLPLPSTTPRRSWSKLSGLRPASFMASVAATTASCEKRAMRRDSRLLMYRSGSKPLTSPEIRQG